MSTVGLSNSYRHFALRLLNRRLDGLELVVDVVVEAADALQNLTGLLVPVGNTISTLQHAARPDDVI